MKTEADSSSTSLCVGCGMCCDGTLFARAKTTLDEEPRLLELGFDLEPLNGKRWFVQPCPMASCGSCTIYENRFAICRSYRCALLKSLDAGEIEFDDAVGKVATAKKLLAAVVALDPKAGQDRHRKKCQDQYYEEFESGDAQLRQEVGPKLLQIAALESFLRRWFRTPDKI